MGPPMQEYRVYIIGSDGHFVRSVELLCPNEVTAKQQAENLVDGHDVELWQADRRIATLGASRTPMDSVRSSSSSASMEYKAIEYRVVQTANPTGFKWTVMIGKNRTRTGVSHTMKDAVRAAERKIDEHLKEIGRPPPR
jgi:hypothetical protein